MRRLRFAFKFFFCILLVFVFSVLCFADDGEDLQGDSVDLEYLSTFGGLTLGDSSGLYINADTVILSEDVGLQPRAFSGGPVGGAYFDLRSSAGDMRIFVPTDYQEGSFSYDAAGNLISVRSATITAYGYIGSTEYSVRFQPYTVPQYRLANSSASYQYLYTNSVIDTNVQVLQDLDSLPLFPNVRVLLLISIVLMGGALLWLCIMR